MWWDLRHWESQNLAWLILGRGQSAKFCSSWNVSESGRWRLSIDYRVVEGEWEGKIQSWGLGTWGQRAPPPCGKKWTKAPDLATCSPPCHLYSRAPFSLPMPDISGNGLLWLQLQLKHLLEIDVTPFWSPWNQHHVCFFFSALKFSWHQLIGMVCPQHSSNPFWTWQSCTIEVETSCPVCMVLGAVSRQISSAYHLPVLKMLLSLSRVAMPKLCSRLGKRVFGLCHPSCL